MMVVVYKVVSGMFVAADAYVAVKREQQIALREPVQLGSITEEELRPYNGFDPNKPLLMAITGKIYDVSRSRDASRALALMSFEPSDLTGNIKGLSACELEVLEDWIVVDTFVFKLIMCVETKSNC
ncbi:hypothetical protein L1887_16849 [Cichorium endivia]|nr:hypothetical protein L1887_16849 [Cichorium endivia]